MGDKIPRDWLTKFRGDLTHQQVAEKAGISRNFYTEIEGGVRNPSPLTAKKIAEVLNFDWTVFFNA